MSESLTTSTPAWTSRFAFLMASIGFAVGLGNIWRFPYVTGENGGGAFVMVYLLCAFAIGAPILMAELMIGRRGQMTPPGSLRKVALENGQSTHWQFVGFMNLLAAFLIMVTYCVVAGWVLNYLFKAVVTGFTGVDGSTALNTFELLLGDVSGMLFWTLLGLVITGSIIYAGVQHGIERAVTVLMPLLFSLMIFLVIYNVFAGGFNEALSYLFTVDFSKISPSVMLAAIGQAFFSIGVAMAGMMTFGAYLQKSVSIPRSVIVIICADTFVALLAGLVIFPAVFDNGLDPAGGPGLIFQTLPVAFAGMPGGHFVSVVFFLLLSVAAITSMVGLIEPLTHWLEENREYSRHRSTLTVLGSIAFLSIFSVLGYNYLSDYGLAGKDINGVLDYFSNQILLPVGGLLIAIFAGWFVDRNTTLDELNMHDGLVFKLWHFLIRLVVPPAVFIVFVLGVGW
ncbi:MAG TPA: sodium-dependent transporter [Pseudomonadales bacterium]|nr:sodium-dependent transporter [Pseudomonadales bacterium]MDP6315931.1 sodium-dependent transporter [Pseudomonadales bacterium]MDP7314283.1 sodium-dependent transporter [Pseudomonadales bacterium]HJP52964.1 sodium-dependent transporter [Pseudomonadales bacterium]